MSPGEREGAPPAGAARLPHDGWAEHYDRVLERTFGSAYASFTELTLDVIRARVRPPARVVDFGAGTGRLAIPLARDGFRVTAVDPSAPMLARLRAGADGLPVHPVRSTLQAYRGTAEHDLALCVFTVLVYLLDEDALAAAAHSMARALRPGGALLIDVPSHAVFESFEVEERDVLRCVEIEPLPGRPGLYRYHERTALRCQGTTVSYEDAFRIREWPRRAIVDALAREGFEITEDLTPLFTRWGAGYLLLRRG